MLSDFSEYWSDKSPLYGWDGVVKPSGVKSLLNEIMRLRIQAHEDGGWCIEHKENRYCYVFLLRCFARSLTRSDIQKELFGVEVSLDSEVQLRLAKHYHSNFSRYDMLFHWMVEFDKMIDVRNKEIIRLLTRCLAELTKDKSLPANLFITKSVSTYLSLAKYSSHFKDLATSNDDDIFRYIFVEDLNSFVGLYLISDFIEQKFSLLNFRTYSSDETGASGYIESEINSAIAYGEAHMQNQINNHMLNNRWKIITGSKGDAEGLFKMNRAKYLFFSNSSQIRIRDALQQCVAHVEKPHQVTASVRHFCLTNMVYLEYLLDSVARNHGKRDYSLHRMEYLLDLTTKEETEPSFLIPNSSLDQEGLVDIDAWVATQELCYANVIFNNIQRWLEDKPSNEPLGIVSRKKKATFAQRKYEHLHMYRLLAIHTTLRAKGRGRKIDVLFEFQSSKQEHYVEILGHLSNSFGFLTDYLVDKERYFTAISLIKLLAVDILLQFSRICAVSGIEIHDDDETGLEFLLKRINWSLERSATALGAFGCEESQAFFYVLSSIVSDPIEDELLDTPRKIANSIQNGLKALIQGFEHEDFSHSPSRISVPILTLYNPIIDFDSTEYLKLASVERW